MDVYFFCLDIYHRFGRSSKLILTLIIMVVIDADSLILLVKKTLYTIRIDFNEAFLICISIFRVTDFLIRY